MAIEAKLDARSEFVFLAVLATGAVEAGRKHSCKGFAFLASARKRRVSTLGGALD